MPKETRSRKRPEPYEKQCPEKSHGTAEIHPLYFFYKAETTGSDPFKDHIIKMAATVANPHGAIQKEYTFQELVGTTLPISKMASSLHGILSSDLKNKEPFSEIFRKFRTWMMKKQKKLSKAEGINYYSVLVAHGGGFHYEILIAEIKRHEVDTSCFKNWDVRFADSLIYLRQVRKEGSKIFEKEDGTKLKLGLPSLYAHFCEGGSVPPARRSVTPAVCDTPHSLSFLSLLQNLLLLDREGAKAAAVWEAMEKLIQQLVLMENPESQGGKILSVGEDRVCAAMKQEHRQKNRKSGPSPPDAHDISIKHTNQMSPLSDSISEVLNPHRRHQGLKGANHLKRIFTESEEPKLSDLLHSIPSQSYTKQLQEYELAKNKREMRKHSYKIKPYQADRLNM